MVDKRDPGAADHNALFRRQAMNASGFRIFSSVSVFSPPSLALALMLALGALLALSAVLFLVEIPERTIAPGVLMPAGGLTEIVAEADGRVVSVLTMPGQKVSADAALLVVRSGSGAVVGSRQSELVLSSLETEMSMRQDEFLARQQEATERIAAANDVFEAAVELHRLGSAELLIQQRRSASMEARLVRRQTLSNDGHLAPDLIELEHHDLLLQQASTVALQQNVTSQSAKLKELRRDIAASQYALDQLIADFGVTKERLRRELTQAMDANVGRYRAPRDAVVAHVLTRAGDVIHRGQVLAKLHAPDAEIEPWIYVATTDARELQPGQRVEIRISAFPLEIFGTLPARITSISAVALRPDELRIPLQLRGPVFEVRARFDGAALRQNDLGSILHSGLQFRADIVKAKHKMYSWLLRSLRASAGQQEVIERA